MSNEVPRRTAAQRPRSVVVARGAARNTRFEIRPLEVATWPDFVRIIEKHNGVWGGCWCVAFHLAHRADDGAAEMNRALKESLVRAGRTHAALVYDGPDVVGWCQFGTPAELPARMTGFAKLGAPVPDWRITCFFVDRDHRRRGVAQGALAGALHMIAAAGGGTVDAYPIAVGRKQYSSSFLWSGTESMFAEAGFRSVGALGARKLVMRKAIRRR